MTANETAIAKTAPHSRRLRFPFVDSLPLFDLRWTLLLLPLWWALGIEQFVWPVAFAFIALKVALLQHGKLRVSAPIKWFALFLVAILISSLFIVEQVRYLTYVRNFGAYVSGFLLLLIITNRVRAWPSARKLLDAALVAMVVASLFGLMAIAGLWRPSFQSVFGSLLPASVAATSYGHEIVVRTLGEPGWFTGLGSYYRINSLYLYGTHYASVLAYALPFFFYRLTTTHGLRRLLVAAAIPLLLLNLIYTTGRVAMVALLAGGIVFMLFYSLQRKAIRALAALLMTIMLLALLVTSFAQLSTPSSSGLVDEVVETVQGLVLARGSGSFTSRFAVYEASISGFLDRPAFGWGTERDIPGSEYPAGSHSEYIAVLYRQGLLGVLAFAGLMWSTWRHSRPANDERRHTEMGGFLRYGRWFFVTALVNSIAADPVIDTTVYVFLWLFLALLLATSRLSHASSLAPASPLAPAAQVNRMEPDVPATDA